MRFRFDNPRLPALPAVSERRISSRRSQTAASALSLLAFIAAASLARAQEEPQSTEPFFAVSSDQTYSPSKQPRIGLQFRQVDRLDFRVYRVKDPAKFFGKLKDAHSFGS